MMLVEHIVTWVMFAIAFALLCFNTWLAKCNVERAIVNNTNAFQNAAIARMLANEENPHERVD